MFGPPPFLSRFFNAFKPRREAQAFKALLGQTSGQGGLVIIALCMITALVIGGATIGAMSFINTNHTIADKQSLQTYYVAQAGIQEAVASRMLPRSNQLNFVGGALPYYNQSGPVYQDPVNRTGLIGVYRYVAVGGDSSRDAGGNYYPNNNLNPGGTPRLVSFDTIPAINPFMVISNAVTCKRRADQGRAALLPDKFQLPLNLNTPSCQAGFEPDEVTVVSEVRMNSETAGAMDKMGVTRIFHGGTNIQIPSSAMVPGYGWINPGVNLNFNSIWNYQPATAPVPGDNSNPLTLKYVVFYDFTTNTIDQAIPVSGGTTVINLPAIPAKDVIRLYFNGPIDYRSISPTYDRQLADCSNAGAANCRIRVFQGTDGAGNGGTVFISNTMIPLFPGGNQVILLPPLTGTLGAGQFNTIRLDTTLMRGYSNQPGPLNYRIIFRT